MQTYASSKMSDEVWLLGAKSRSGSSTESESGSRGEHLVVYLRMEKRTVTRS